MATLALVLVALVGLAVFPAGAPPAAAHDSPPELRAVVDRVHPQVDGLSVRVQVSVVPELVVRNRSTAWFTVLDDEGRPFLRIGADGVEADLSQPAWYAANDPEGAAGPVPPEAPSGWTRVSDQDTWAWFDRRLHPPSLPAPAAPSAGSSGAAPSPAASSPPSHSPPSAGSSGAARSPAASSPPSHSPSSAGSSGAAPSAASAPSSSATTGSATPPAPAHLADWSIPIRVGEVAGRIDGHLALAPLRGRVEPRLLGDGALGAGATLTLLPGRVPGFLLAPGQAHDLLVEGRFGEPFARITADGAAYNAVSPTWHDHARMTSSLPLPGHRSDPGASPLWEALPGRTVAWLDLRGRYPLVEPPDDVVAARREARLLRWTVPVVVDGRRVELAGETVWRPLGATAVEEAGLPLVPFLLGAAGLLAVATALRSRRYGRRPPRRASNR